MLLAILIVPAARLQPAFDVDRLAFAQMLLADLGQIAPRDDVEPLRLFASVAIAGYPRAVNGYADAVTGRPLGV